MELIERYLTQVARRLPPARRDDVVTELRSSLHDSLEARTAGGEDRDEAVTDLLREYGPPAGLADSYIERPRFLVGPELYPAFVRVVVITVAIVTGLVVFAALAGSVRAGSVDFSSLALGLWSNVLQTAIAVLGWVVIVFWVVERFGRREAREGRDWDPAALPPVHDPDRVSRAGLAVGLFFLSFFLVVLNLFEDRIVALVSFDGSVATLPLMGPGLRANVALISGVLGAVLVLRLVVLVRGRWNSVLRWIDLGLDVVWIAVLLRLVRTPRLLAADTEAATAAGWSSEQIAVYTQTVVPTLQTLVTVGLIAALVGCCVGLVVGFGRLIARHDGSPLTAPDAT